MIRAALPLSIAVVVAAGVVLYGINHRGSVQRPSRSAPIAVTEMPGVGEAERTASAKQEQPGATAAAVGTATVLPINGLRPSDIQDTFYQSRGGGERTHEATDILAPRGTPVHAMVDGVIQKLFLSKPGGITVYEFDSNAEYCYYYAHLDRYSEGLVEGRYVHAGDVIGYVGSSGNADPGTPHLHLAILKLGPEKKWWEGNTPVNPYPLLMRLVDEH